MIRITFITIFLTLTSCITKVIHEPAQPVKDFSATQQPVQNQYYYPATQHYNPYQYSGPSYNPYGNTGGSRFYSNPYAIPAAPQYMRYDSDQYYAPPTYYNAREVQQQTNPFYREQSPF